MIVLGGLGGVVLLLQLFAFDPVQLFLSRGVPAEWPGVKRPQ